MSNGVKQIKIKKLKINMLIFIKYLSLFLIFIIIKRHLMSLFLVNKIKKKIDAINIVLKLKSYSEKDEFMKYINEKNLIIEIEYYIKTLNKIENSNKSIISKLIFNHVDFYNKKREFIKLASSISY